MVEQYLRQGPLDHLQLVARAASTAENPVGMAELPFLAMVNLRGAASDAAFTDAVKGVLGAELPTVANTWTSSTKGELLWLGPDEWLAISAKGEETAIADKLRKALDGQHASVTEVGEARTTIRLSGPRARDVIAKGCPLDLHPSVFADGQCAQSHIGRALTLLQCRDRETIDIHVLRSFAEYLWIWLEDAAREYGVSVLEA